MSRTTFRRGDVVWAPDFFKLTISSELGAPNPRPWLVISRDSHPFSGEEYVALSLTTSERGSAVELDASDWEIGGGPKKSYVAPWNPATLKHGWVGENRQGRLREGTVQEAVGELEKYI